MVGVRRGRVGRSSRVSLRPTVAEWRVVCLAHVLNGTEGRDADGGMSFDWHDKLGWAVKALAS